MVGKIYFDRAMKYKGELFLKYKQEVIYPRGEVVNAQTPVVVTLHGMGTNYLNLRPLMPIFALPIIEIHLEGDLTYGDGYTYYIPEFIHQSEEAVITETALAVHTEVAAILANRGLAENPLNVLGFSQGAILAAALSVLYPSWINNGVLLSGRLPAFLWKTAQTKLKSKKLQTACFISQGEKDPLFPVEAGQELARFFRTYAVIEPEYHVYPFGHGVSYQAVEDIYNWYVRLHART